MTFKLQRVSRRPDWPRQAVIVTGVWLALVAGATLWGACTHRDICLCAFRGATGLPCPGCGGTRATVSLLRGDVVGALAWNPLVTVVVCFLAMSLLLRLAAGRKVEINLGRRHNAIVLAGAIVLLAANWVYVLHYVK
jgi:hypothetical protein